MRTPKPLENRRAAPAANPHSPEVEARSVLAPGVVGWDERGENPQIEDRSLLTRTPKPLENRTAAPAAILHLPINVEARFLSLAATSYRGSSQALLEPQLAGRIKKPRIWSPTASRGMSLHPVRRSLHPESRCEHGAHVRSPE
jgi:hypothetical protein